MSFISLEDYDIILDALDNEDTNKILKCFQKFELEPGSLLFDAPRFGNNNIEINTYLDYIICYNLTDIIDAFINELNLEISDDVFASCITLCNHDTYRYFCELGYIPESTTFITAVQYCCSTIVDSILEYDKDMIYLLDEEHIENIFNCNVDEETVETIRVLFTTGDFLMEKYKYIKLNFTFFSVIIQNKKNKLTYTIIYAKYNYQNSLISTHNGEHTIMLNIPKWVNIYVNLLTMCHKLKRWILIPNQKIIVF